jgi:hypothetical protein
MKPINPNENATHSTSEEIDTLEKRFEEFSEFAGEWLLLKGDQLLAHSHDYQDINAEIQKRHLKDCFVHYVPTSTERDFILI